MGRISGMTDSELFPEARYDLGVERGASNMERGVGFALLAGGGLGLLSGMLAKNLTASEKRWAAGASVLAGATGGVMAVQPLGVAVPARISRGWLPIAWCATATCSTALGGGDSSPAYFPAVLLTALSSGSMANRTWGLVSGSAVAAGYLGGCAKSIVAREARLSRQAWGNVALSFGFLGAGVVGAIAGDVTLRGRALTDYAARDIEADATGGTKEDIDRTVETIKNASRELLGLLPDVRLAFERDGDVNAIGSTMATALASLSGADTQMDEPQVIGYPGTVRTLRRTADNYNVVNGNVQVSFEVKQGWTLALPWEITTALNDSLVALVQNAANVRRDDAPKVNVTVTLETVLVPRESGRRRPCIRLAVEDDAGGGDVSESDWGRGLNACRRAADNLGGSFTVEAGGQGVRAVMTVPRVRAGASRAHSLTLGAQFEASREAGLDVLRWVTSAQSLFILFEQNRPGSMKRNLAKLTGIVGAAQLTRFAKGQTCSLLEAGVSVAAMGAFRGPGRPPLGGLACVLCAGASARGDGAIGTAGATAGAVLATAVAGPERFKSGLGATIGDRTFPFVGGLGGLGMWNALLHTREQENDLAHEAWRRKLLDQLAAPAQARHHYLEPLENAVGAERWAAFLATELGERVESACMELDAAQSQLARRLTVGNPLRSLQHQLARLLAPAPVLALGTRPTSGLSPDKDHELEAVEYRLALIRVGEEVAQRIRSQMPAVLAGRSQLQEVQLHVRPASTATEITVIQVPYKARAREKTDSSLTEACRAAGGDARLMAGEGFSVTVNNMALR
jgi:hypothetical protein